MEYYRPRAKDLAVGVILFLGVIFIMACGLDLFRSQSLAGETVEGVAAFTPTPRPTLPAVTPTDKPVGPLPTQLPAQESTPAHPPSPNAPTPIHPTPTGESQPLTPPTQVATVEDTSSSGAEGLSSSGVKIYETTITLPTYPVKDFLDEQIDPTYNLAALYLKRPDYEAVGPAVGPVDYTGVVLENAYLRLTFLPELGGRLYSAVIKAGEQEIFYHNRVVKPSRYGVLKPAEANWWLAMGGMEWAYPTQEHGYRWGVPWQYKVTQAAHGATITLSDMAAGRVGAEVRVTLPADSATFMVQPRLVNGQAEAVPVQFWLNAALTLSPDSMSPQTRFIVPVDSMIVHSRGEPGWSVPDAQMETPWPIVGETDLSDYSQWANYLGFFVPYLEAPFIGAYNPTTDLGVVRLIEPGQVPGTKVFAFGTGFPDRSYTDDNSQYFEIWGGANTGFWPEADVLVPPGGVLAWQESWWPVAGLGGITWASQHAVIHLSSEGDTQTLSALLARPQQGTVTIWAGDQPILSEPFTASPAGPVQWRFGLGNKVGRIQLVDNQGAELLNYQPDQDKPIND